ncbi:MAG: hypothetical protein AAFO07_31415, partial [Bacteroidota bacterium]
MNHSFSDFFRGKFNFEVIDTCSSHKIEIGFAYWFIKTQCIKCKHTYSRNRIKISCKFSGRNNPFSVNGQGLATPKTMWEVGLHGGAPFVGGEVNPGLGYGGGISIRKSIDYIFSIRLDGFYGIF